MVEICVWYGAGEQPDQAQHDADAATQGLGHSEYGIGGV